MIARSQFSLRTIAGSFCMGQAWRNALCVCLLAVCGSGFAAEHAHGHGGCHGHGRAENPIFPADEHPALEHLPAGELRDSLAELPAAAQAQAMATMAQAQVGVHDLPHLRVHACGGVSYECYDAELAEMDVLAEEGEQVSVEAAEEASGGTGTVWNDGFTPEGPVPVSSPPVFNSRPGASNIIYLDFNGDVITKNIWNNYAGVETIEARAYNMDSAGYDPTIFEEEEQSRIHQVWQRMAEDFAPFDVNVTTDPYYDDIANRGPTIGQVLFSHSQDFNSTNAAGRAFLDVFGLENYTYYQPALVFYNGSIGERAMGMAETGSHEAGHNMGLSHDGTSTEEYYYGHGWGEVLWGPIMGSSTGRDCTQWSNGEYYDASQLQDDEHILTSKLGIRADDHGNSISSATALAIADDGTIDRSLSTNQGIILNTSDIDVFSFAADAGGVFFRVDPFVSDQAHDALVSDGGNLDVGLRLYDGGGALLVETEPNITTRAEIQATVPAGTYYLEVRGVGQGDPYSSSPSGYVARHSTGQFFISGRVGIPVSEPETIMVNFQPAGSVVPEGYVADTGSAFGSRGGNLSYGWDGDNFRTRDRGDLNDPLLDTLNHCQKSGNHTWEIALPNGNYEVTVISSDPAYVNSSNDFVIEGQLVTDFDGYDHLDLTKVTVPVADGRLTISPAASAENAKISVVEIRPVAASVAINFQAAGLPAVPGYFVDAGNAYSDRGNGESYGWDEDNFNTRNRNRLNDPLLDTLNHCQKGGTRTWELAIADGTYEVVVTSSDPSYSNMINDFDIEGETVLDPDGEDVLDISTATVVVTDGRLTIVPAETASNAKMSVVEVRPVTPTSIAINFQPESLPAVPGYRVDAGEAFGNRGNGESYGWDQDNFNTRNRKRLDDPLLDTLNHCQKGGTRSWELAIADGDYLVTLTSSDPRYSNMINDFIIEGQTVYDLDGEDVLDVVTVPVTVTDGRLTITPAPTASNAKISVVEIEPLSLGSAADS